MRSSSGKFYLDTDQQHTYTSENIVETGRNRESKWWSRVNDIRFKFIVGALETLSKEIKNHIKSSEYTDDNICEYIKFTIDPEVILK